MFASKTLGVLSRRLSSPAATSHLRAFSSEVRAFPAYGVFGDDCLMSFKFMPPQFTYNPRNQILNVDPAKRGRLMIEWVPRNPDGTVTRDRDTIVRFALSPEEVGLILNQIPQQQAVVLERRTPTNESLVETSQSPHKVCKIEPNPEYASVKFTFDYEIDGIGGQTVRNARTPMSVEMQAGEVQVALEIMRQSLPSLAGWKTCEEIALRNVVEMTKSGGYGAPPVSEPEL